MHTSHLKTELQIPLKRFHLSVFLEPRGMLRLLQIVLAILTALTLKSYTGHVNVLYCSDTPQSLVLPYKYPFDMEYMASSVNCRGVDTLVSLTSDVSSEARFFYLVCWISVLYAAIASLSYILFRDNYSRGGVLTIIDFFTSVSMSCIWVASSAAWFYALAMIMKFTNPDFLMSHLNICVYSDYFGCYEISRDNVFALNVTFIFCFLNLFLWSAGVWFVYKETPWFAIYELEHGTKRNYDSEQSCQE